MLRTRCSVNRITSLRCHRLHGLRRSTLRSRRRVNCSAPSTRCWVVAVCRLWTTSVQNSSIVTSMTRSPVFDLRRPTTVSMRSHVTKTVSACFAVLRQLRSVRRSVPMSVLQLLVTSLVLTRLLAASRKCHSRRHSAVPAEAPSVGDEFCCSACVFLVEVRAHHPTPPSTTLTEGSGAD